MVRPEAEADIAEAYNWYQSRAPGIGEDFLEAVDEALASIREMPERFPVLYREAEVAVRRARLRRFPYGVHFTYDPPRRGITVVACMHGRRDPRRWLRRL